MTLNASRDRMVPCCTPGGGPDGSNAAAGVRAVGGVPALRRAPAGRVPVLPAGALDSIICQMRCFSLAASID